LLSHDVETIAVVVVTFNSERLLADLVESLPVGLDGIDWHLTIADNASSDGSVATARRLAPYATVVETGRNGGYAAGINAAVAAARPRTAILVLNPDVRLMSGCGRELLRALRTAGTGVAVPRLVDAKGKLIASMRREPTVLRTLGDTVLGAHRAGRYRNLGENVMGDDAYQVESVTDWAEGSTLLLSSECWQTCGEWDESFFLYCEEAEYLLRARDRGLATRYTPLAHAIHLEGGGRLSPGLWTVLTLNRVRLFRRRNGRTRAAAFFGATLFREITRGLIGYRTSRIAVRSLLSPARWRQAPGPEMVQSIR
jgi:GT2 family glycosyltransferase